MLDIKFIRENTDIVKKGMALKQVNIDIDEIIALDAKRRRMSKENDDLKFKRNSVTKEISLKKRNREDASAEIKAMQEVSAAIKGNNKVISEIETELQT